MAFVVTARKWRPKTFAEVVGQSHITQTLINALSNGRIAHAYMFAGPRGIGKTTTARLLAKTLNCLAPVNGEPCNKCELCNDFYNSSTLDVFEIDGASNRRIEEIRTIREAVKYTPTKGKYKIYIIDEVHMLTTESFNALLKTLEEPPEHVVFIFATTDIHKVPLTIISRCQRFDFRRVDLRETKGLLAKIAKAEGISIDDQSLTLIAKKADGALRDAQSLFDQVVSFCGMNVQKDQIVLMLNLIDEELYFDISDGILDRDFSKALFVTDKIYTNGWNLTDFLNGLLEHFRNFITLQITKGTDLIESSDIIKGRYAGYINKFNEVDLLRIVTFINKIQYEIKNTNSQKLKLEIALFQLIGLEKASTISDLINVISEKGLGNVNIISEPQVEYKPTPVISSSPSNKPPAATNSNNNTQEPTKIEYKIPTENETPLVRAIFTELGGREYK
ncbi:MAG: DNA polymerase III subunit gamma/tau [bacterium]